MKEAVRATSAPKQRARQVEDDYDFDPRPDELCGLYDRATYDRIVALVEKADPFYDHVQTPYPDERTRPSAEKAFSLLREAIDLMPDAPRSAEIRDAIASYSGTSDVVFRATFCLKAMGRTHDEIIAFLNEAKKKDPVGAGRELEDVIEAKRTQYFDMIREANRLSRKGLHDEAWRKLAEAQQSASRDAGIANSPDVAWGRGDVLKREGKRLPWAATHYLYAYALMYADDGEDSEGDAADQVRICLKKAKVPDPVALRDELIAFAETTTDFNAIRDRVNEATKDLPPPKPRKPRKKPDPEKRLKLEDDPR